MPFFLGPCTCPSVWSVKLLHFFLRLTFFFFFRFVFVCRYVDKCNVCGSQMRRSYTLELSYGWIHPSWIWQLNLTVHAPNHWAISVVPCLLLLLRIASGTHVLWRTGPSLGPVILDTDALRCLSISSQWSSSCVPQTPASAAVPMETLLTAHSRSHFLLHSQRSMCISQNSGFIVWLLCSDIIVVIVTVALPGKGFCNSQNFFHPRKFYVTPCL